MQLKEPPALNNPVPELIGAWITFGSGQKSQAIANLEKIKGPIWYNLFIHYHIALMNDLAERTEDAKKYFVQALNNKQGNLIAPNTYERIVIAYASFQLRHNMRNQALQTIKHGEQMLSGREVLKNYPRKN